MGISWYVDGIRPPDATWRKMKAVLEACREAKIAEPKEVREFFKGETPDEKGVLINLGLMYEKPKTPGVERYEGEESSGFEVDLDSFENTIRRVVRRQRPAISPPIPFCVLFSGDCLVCRMPRDNLRDPTCIVHALSGSLRIAQGKRLLLFGWKPRRGHQRSRRTFSCTDDTTTPHRTTSQDSTRIVGQADGSGGPTLVPQRLDEARGAVPRLRPVLHRGCRDGDAA